MVVRAFDFKPSFDPVPGENYKIIADPELKYDLVPGSVYLGDAINAAGMRDRPREIAKPPGHFRIACIGDSVTFGLYVNMEDAYPARLEKLLNERFDAGGIFEVLNFGVTGYNITQVAATLRKRVLAYAPDLILYAYCLNDPSEYSLEYALLRGQIDPRQRRYLDGVVHRTNRLANFSHLYRLVYYAWSAESHNWGYGAESALGQRTNPSRIAGGWYLDQHKPGPGWDRVTEGLSAIASAAAENKTPVVLVIFPLLDQLEDYPCIEIHNRVRAAAQQRSFHVIDLLEPFQKAAAVNSATIRKDELHPTPAGHAIVAEAMLDGLVNAGLLPGSPSRQTETAP